MATFIDISILKNFAAIFTWLLVWVVVYGLLETFKAFGEGKRGIHSMIALVLAFLVSFSSGVVAVIQTFLPWFMVLVLVIFFILFAVRMFGVDTKTITGAITQGSALTWILIFTAVIVLFSLGSGFGQKTLEEGQKGGMAVSVAANATNATVTPTNTGDFNQNLYNTLYHPKVLGLILVMMMVVLVLLFLATSD